MDPGLGGGACCRGSFICASRIRFSVRSSSRVAFIELAVDTLGLSNVKVFAGKVEQLAGPYDVCLSRAFADLDGAWTIAERLLSPTGKLLFWAGRTFDAAAEAPARASISVSPAPRLADAGAVVIMSRQ